MNINEYKNKFNRDNYYAISFRVPKEYRTQLQELSQSEGKSINQLIIDALNKTYNIDLLLKSKDCDRYITKKLQVLGEMGFHNLAEAEDLLKFESGRSEIMTEKIKLIDMAFDKLLNRF